MPNPRDIQRQPARHGELARDGGPAIVPEPDSALTIDCDSCALQDSDACDDCVVSFLLGRAPEDAVIIDAEEARAMRLLGRAGLVPTLRFSSRAG